MQSAYKRRIKRRMSERRAREMRRQELIARNEKILAGPPAPFEVQDVVWQASNWTGMTSLKYYSFFLGITPP